MRAGGSKQKGASWEREVCRSLSLWVSDGSQEDCFWRSAMSGGRSTVAARKGKRLATQAGDISSIHAAGNSFADKFLIECKHYSTLDWHGLLTGKGNLSQFWERCCGEASRCHKYPLLVAKQNHLPPIACLDYAGVGVLGLADDVLIFAPKQSLHIVHWASFLSYATKI